MLEYLLNCVVTQEVANGSEKKTCDKLSSQYKIGYRFICRRFASFKHFSAVCVSRCFSRAMSNTIKCNQSTGIYIAWMFVCVCRKKCASKKLQKISIVYLNDLWTRLWLYADWFGNAIENGKQMKCDNAKEANHSTTASAATSKTQMKKKSVRRVVFGEWKNLYAL